MFGLIELLFEENARGQSKKECCHFTEYGKENYAGCNARAFGMELLWLRLGSHTSFPTPSIEFLGPKNLLRKQAQSRRQIF